MVDDQVNGNFLFVYGVTNQLELDVAFPVTFVETGAGTSPITGGRALRDTAVRDLRFGFTYALVPRLRMDPAKAGEEGGEGKSWSLAARMNIGAPTGDQTDFAGEHTAVFIPDLAADYRLARLFLGASLGMRIRPVAEFAGARIGTQITTGYGAGVDIVDDEKLSLLLEGRTYWTLATQHETSQSAFGISSKEKSEGRTILPSEWLLGVRSAPWAGGDVSFYAGGGGPIPLGPDAITVPRFRFVLGATYAPTQRDTDHDGVPDRVDFCPNQPGEKHGERPGCPP